MYKNNMDLVFRTVNYKLVHTLYSSFEYYKDIHYKDVEEYLGYSRRESDHQLGYSVLKYIESMDNRYEYVTKYETVITDNKMCGTVKETKVAKIYQVIYNG